MPADPSDPSDPSDPTEPTEPREIVLVTTPAPVPARSLFDVVTSTVGLAVRTATTLGSILEQSAVRVVAVPVGAGLDRLVPMIVDAVLDRIDLTDLVLRRVDLAVVVQRALDEIDLTAIVVDQVDLDHVVAQVDLDAIIDRVPVIDLANYVVDEIDLPQLIRDSTSGVAGDAMNMARRQAIGADQLLATLTDRLVLRRRARRLEAPGRPVPTTDTEPR